MQFKVVGGKSQTLVLDFRFCVPSQCCFYTPSPPSVDGIQISVVAVAGTLTFEPSADDLFSKIFALETAFKILNKFQSLKCFQLERSSIYNVIA